MSTSSNLQVRIPSTAPRRLLFTFLFVTVVFGTVLGLAATPALAQPPSKVLGHWEFDDPENLGLDSSNHNRQGTVVGAQASAGRVRAGGTTSGAAYFDGTGAFLEIPRAKLLSRLSTVTVEAWVNSYGGEGSLFFVPGSVALETGAFEIEERRAEVLPRVAAPVPVERWYHLAAVFDGPELRLYVDGRLVDVDILAVDRLEGVAAAPWVIGARFKDWKSEQQRGLEYPFQGLVDEVKVYETALSATEILRHAEDVDRWPRIVVEAKTGDAIQQALDQASPSGSEVFMPAGNYLLKRPIQVPAGVMLRGETGTVLKPAPDSKNAVSPAILLNGVQGVTLRNFALDGQASVLEQSAGHLGILITGSSHVHLDQLTISDLGQSRKKPAGLHLLLESREPADAKKVRGIPLITGLVSERNVIENCRFLDADYKASLGLRFMTSWKPRKKGATFVAPVRKSVVRRNILQGFAHNALEIAGPATEDNLIRQNSSNGAYLTAIEADKGARFNLFLKNTVRRVSSPEPVVVAAMRDQGAYPHHWAEGNEFRENIIHGVTSDKWAAGILLSFTRNGIFQDNTIRGISARNPAFAAGVVLRGGEVKNYLYHPNKIDNLLSQVKMIPPPASRKDNRAPKP